MYPSKVSLPHRSSETLISASSQEGECLTWLLAALISCAGLHQSLQKASHFKWALLHFKCVFLEQCPAFICIVINPADLLRLGAAFQNPDSKYPSQNLVIFHYLVLSSVQSLSGTAPRGNGSQGRNRLHWVCCSRVLLSPLLLLLLASLYMHMLVKNCYSFSRTSA